MEKGLKVGLIGLLLFVFSSVGNAFAWDPYDFIGTSAWRNNAWVETDTFAFDEKPWLHLVIPDDVDFTWDLTTSAWTAEGSGVPNFTIPILDSFVRDTKNSIYVSFNDNRWFGLNGWQEIRKTGDWDINAWSVVFDGFRIAGKFNGDASFTVTPEPVSAVLFWLGGGLLAAQVVRKKRKA